MQYNNMFRNDPNPVIAQKGLTPENAQEALQYEGRPEVAEFLRACGAKVYGMPKGNGKSCAGKRSSKNTQAFVK